jgi:hypothetical protein
MKHALELEHAAHRHCMKCIFVVRKLWEKATTCVHIKHEISESAILNQIKKS